MKKRLVLILNGKGGVGKSFFAVNFIQYLKDRPFPHVAFDSDNENSTLKRFHPEAGFLNLASPRGLDPMIQSLDGSNLVVVDCRAASTDLFLDFFTSTDLSELLAGLDAALTLAMLVGAELDSIEQIQRLIHELVDRCQYLAILTKIKESPGLSNVHEIDRRSAGPSQLKKIEPKSRRQGRCGACK